MKRNRGVYRWGRTARLVRSIRVVIRSARRADMILREERLEGRTPQ